MFNTKPKAAQGGNEAPPTSVNIIGAGTTIDGEIKSNGDLRIDGTVNGSVHSKSKVVVGPTGTIDGDVHCQNADISGSVRGTTNVTDTLFLKSTAQIQGDIVTGKFVVEVGANFTGNCNMGQVKGIQQNDRKPEQQALREKVG